jgi:hypothetical protein
MLTDGVVDLATTSRKAPESAGLSEWAVREAGIRSLSSRLPALSDLAVASLRASEPAYRDNVPTGDLQMARSGLQILEACRGLPEERGATTAWARDVGRRRAQQGVPLDALLRAYHIGGQVLFTALLQWGSDVGVPQERSAMVADDVWNVVDLHCAAATTSYRAVEDELSGGRVAECGHLLDALLNGDADREAVTAAARAWALPERGRYIVVVQRPSDWGAPPLSLAELPVRVAGIRVAWRIHGGCAIGVIALGDAPLAKIATASPSMPGRRTGISLVVEGISELGRARRLAELAVRTVTTRDGTACLAERLPAALLTARPDLARELSTRVLGPVLALDKVSRDMLLDTFAAWLEADGSALRTAAALFCHRNTVLNRMRRLERLTQRSLSAPNDLVELALALEAFGLRTASS